MRIDSLIQEHELSMPKRCVKVIVHLNGTVSLVGTDDTFPNEKSMVDHFKDKPVKLLLRRIVKPETRRVNHAN